MKAMIIKMSTGLLAMAQVQLLADVTPSNLFGDHMVLQRDMPVAVWGTAAPGEPVMVRFAGTTKSTKPKPIRSYNVPTNVSFTPTKDCKGKSADTKKPVACRYAFSGKPTVNLVNAEGLPTYPFKTDNWAP